MAGPEWSDDPDTERMQRQAEWRIVGEYLTAARCAVQSAIDALYQADHYASHVGAIDAPGIIEELEAVKQRLYDEHADVLTER